MAGNGICKGDEGSPLVCPVPSGNNRYYHAGIVSGNIQCGETGAPGIFANVAHFRNWIDQQVKSHGYDTDVYSFNN